jgi:hypothetical protein
VDVFFASARQDQLIRIPDRIKPNFVPTKVNHNENPIFNHKDHKELKERDFIESVPIYVFYVIFGVKTQLSLFLSASFAAERHFVEWEKKFNHKEHKDRKETEKWWRGGSDQSTRQHPLHLWSCPCVLCDLCG